ncbi:MAG: transporter substrate-binding domain-containing protein [Rhodoferax sp.]|nr:transporter substrate-binding domain-containing protein [Rhodoferax sp.]
MKQFGIKAVFGAAALALVGHMAQAAELKVSIAAEPYPPFFEKQADGKWKGFEVDLANKICAEIRAQCKMVELAWDGLIPALKSKKIDLIFSSMSITPERSKVIAFSVPYYYTEVEFIAPKTYKADTSPAGLQGKILGVQSATTHADFAKKYYAKTAKIKYYNTQDELNADMVAGRVDIMLLDALAAQDFLATKPAAALVGKGYTPKDPLFGPGVGAGMRKEDLALKAQVDAAIKKIYASGEFDTLQKQYFKIDIKAK